MKFALFIIAVCIMTLHATAVAGQLHGYVYTIAEYAGQVYTGYMKVGHSSEADVPDPEAKYLNIKRRFTNMKSGNPRHLEKKQFCECTSKNTAKTVEKFIQKSVQYDKKFRFVGSANGLGGSNEWLKIPDFNTLILVMRKIARNNGCTCSYKFPFKTDG